MRRVLLLGDSIRMGYENETRRRLHGEAFVMAPSENGQHTVNLLLRLWEWAVMPRYDAIHLNAGLWDVRRVATGRPGTIVPLDAYRANVRAALETLRRETDARLVWATTTPIHPERYAEHARRMGHPGRDPDDIARYNAAAVEEARAAGAAVNDLHAAVVEAGKDDLLCDDGVHFTAPGASFLADRVAAALRAAW